MIKTTKKDFDLFKKECKKWINIFDLNNYDIVYRWMKFENGNDAAQMSNYANYTATIDLDKEIDDNNYSGTEISLVNFIKECAKHEMIHLLLGRLSINSRARFVNASELSEAEEEIVRKLDKIIK